MIPNWKPNDELSRHPKIWHCSLAQCSNYCQFDSTDLLLIYERGNIHLVPSLLIVSLFANIQLGVPIEYQIFHVFIQNE